MKKSDKNHSYSVNDANSNDKSLFFLAFLSKLFSKLASYKEIFGSEHKVFHIFLIFTTN